MRCFSQQLQHEPVPSGQPPEWLCGPSANRPGQLLAPVELCSADVALPIAMPEIRELHTAVYGFLAAS